MSDLLRFTLLAEGSSDRALVPLLTWLLKQHVRADLEPVGQPVVEGRLPPGAIATPRDRLRSAVDVFPCDLLFIHRDADRHPWADRLGEINGWLAEAAPLATTAAVPVIPVRTTEAWLLADESAVRRAAGNRSGSMRLTLPALARLESEPDPKGKLLAALRTASGRRGRRLKAFDAYAARGQVGDHIDDPACLRRLSAFARLEDHVRAACHRHGWV